MIGGRHKRDREGGNKWGRRQCTLLAITQIQRVLPVTHAANMEALAAGAHLHHQCTITITIVMTHVTIVMTHISIMMTHVILPCPCQ